MVKTVINYLERYNEFFKGNLIKGVSAKRELKELTLALKVLQQVESGGAPCYSKEDWEAGRQIIINLK